MISTAWGKYCMNSQWNSFTVFVIELCISFICFQNKKSGKLHNYLLPLLKKSNYLGPHYALVRQWNSSRKPYAMNGNCRELSKLRHAKHGQIRPLGYYTLLYESPKDSLGKCFVLLSIGTHLMKL